ncbi:unnamed protein product [Mytilus edulis]|uniref:Uncharacterized protein n=1 Tax=Mytilus edulis TaxID=6550 RepID=A0A8S3TN48_MYTED|nr:unnamed protein product [Mytilus edulis]
MRSALGAADGRAVKKLKTVKQDKRQKHKEKTRWNLLVVRLVLLTMVIMVVFHSNSPFLSLGPPPHYILAGTELGTSVTTVVCMDIGQKTVKKGEIQQLPEEHQTERSPDILKFILDLIENGYKIPLINEPESVLLRNNKSALEHKDFVEKAVQELIDASLIEEVSNRPHVVNQLTVSINLSGLYLQNLIQSANHYSAIESAFYGIKWAHNFVGVANPCDSEMRFQQKKKEEDVGDTSASTQGLALKGWMDRKTGQINGKTAGLSRVTQGPL